MASIFTQIVRGEIPCYPVYEDDAHYAFLDINPITPGHTLLVPKREVDYLFDLDPEDLAALWKAAQRVAAALKQATGCARVVTTVVGYEVPHAHVHLIPTREINDFPIPPRGSLDGEDAAAFSETLRALLTS